MDVKKVGEFIKKKMKEYNIPADRVIRHFDVSGKICPKYFVEDEKAWKEFKAKLTTDTKKGYTGKFPSLGIKGCLKKGDKGTNVGKLQDFLNWAVNAGLKKDNSFGPLVEKAVLKYQKTYGLAVDGFFGPACLKKAKTIKK